MNNATIARELYTAMANKDSDDHAMIAYNLEFPAPIGLMPTTALMTFKDDIISSIELFNDARPFGQK